MANKYIKSHCVLYCTIELYFNKSCEKTWNYKSKNRKKQQTFALYTIKIKYIYR